jgi:hypothetical protein
LNDLGNGFSNDWYKEMLETIISLRYNELKPTIFTTSYYPSFYIPNLVANAHKSKKVIAIPKDKLLDSRLSPQTISQIESMSIPIWVKGGK